MEFWKFPTFFFTPTKLINMDFYFTMCQSYVFETLGHWMNYVIKIKDPLNEWNVILIYYVTWILKFLNFFNYLKKN
jgi:hypothetical protein